jgi:NAD(P)H dehydrogenase (quinone)
VYTSEKGGRRWPTSQSPATPPPETSTRSPRRSRRGPSERRADVRLRRVAELARPEAIDSNPAWCAHLDATAKTPEATHGDLRWADAYAFGTPARYGNVSSQLKQFLGTTAPLWAAGELADKPVNRHGGNESTLLAL